MTAGYSRERPIFRDFSADLLGPGMVQVTGPNGCGKSTLLELISGYLHPWTGLVQVAGRPAASPAARDLRRVCRTEPALYPHMSVRDHLVFASRCAGVGPTDALDRAAGYALEPWLDHQAASLSAGNARRLWFVMCTLGRFSVVCLDEPFNGVDAEGRAEMVQELIGWAKEALVVLVSHQMPATLSADRTVSIPGTSIPGTAATATPGTGDSAVIEIGSARRG